MNVHSAAGNQIAYLEDALTATNERIRELSAICDEVCMVANENGYDSIAALIEWFPLLAKSYDQLTAEREVSDKLATILTCIGDAYFSTLSVSDYHIITDALAEVAAVQAKGEQPTR